ncbi:hypothetical protein FSB73_00120 [Arachidicoccus ginsenosidivorans]|uniref:Uncharacterized protein n=1 Tax=Arachidicoccus ginsenosidivorans TaxID=496057 RepID=A0A5B8VGR9_9BACT|nr:hypothetical protein [Arachidicoccus ginsenosidivorans]QEC70353.1 hypothetical protein FSB73_00120 [Arachidicoccus ginsenosidivorans]
MKNNKHKNTAKHRHVSKNAQVKMKNRGKENPYVASRLRQLELHCYYNDCAEPFPELKQVCIAREHPDGTMTYLYLGMQDRMGIIENFKTEISIDRQRFDDLLQYFKLHPFNDVMALERLIYDTRACQAFWMLPLPKQLPMALGMLSHKQNKIQKAKRLATFQEVQANIAIVETAIRNSRKMKYYRCCVTILKITKTTNLIIRPVRILFLTITVCLRGLLMRLLVIRVNNLLAMTHQLSPWMV